MIEVNPRASRTVPFVSKSIGVPLASYASRCMLGETLEEIGFTEEVHVPYVSVKEAVFPFVKFPGVDVPLSPEMKSTGEAIGYDAKLSRAMYKALQAAGVKLQNYGTVLATIANEDKEEALPLIRRFYNLGFNI